MKIIQPTPDKVTGLDLRSEKQKLLEMEIHESFQLQSIDILRVVGGWIYTTYSVDYYETGGMSSTFVPLPQENT